MQIRTVTWLLPALALGFLTACPDDGETPAADTGGMDAGMDAALDTGSGDTGSGDTGMGDTGSSDTGMGDAGMGDAGMGDAGMGDAGMGDATDAMEDTGPGPEDTMGDAMPDTTADADAGGKEPLDPATAPRALIDRFSPEAGTLMVRDDTNGLPEAGVPIDMDMPPFVTQGLGPAGQVVRYYNFDVQPLEPEPIFVLFREGEDTPVDGQLNIVDSIPGDADYNDFWHPHRVTVPADYVANTVTSYADIVAGAYTMEPMDVLVNCPIVPEGSTAALSLGSEDPQPLTMGWYEDQVVFYFSFEEAPLAPVDDKVPTSPIYVTFNVNPPDGGPASGFVTEPESTQTHNVVETLPGDAAYSPLWSVNVYDNADFDAVGDLASVLSATILAADVATVNCPIVDIIEPLDPATAPRALIDRFSAEAGTLMVRDDTNGLPEAGVSINMDVPPFITQGLGPAGQIVKYYNFDVQPLDPEPIFVLFREGADAPVPGQLNIVDSIPGDADYNDFWHPHRVTVPADYVANTVTSYADIVAGAYTMEPMDVLVNCPIVPEGSTAALSLGSEDPQPLTMGWYEDQVVFYFSFEEAPLAPVDDKVPTSPIYVTFNVNPPDGGPASGFVTEPESTQTHNVVETLPGDAAYSPLWSVNVYDNADFDAVGDLASVLSATILAADVATVNCPIVDMAQ